MASWTRGSGGNGTLNVPIDLRMRDRGSLATQCAVELRLSRGEASGLSCRMILLFAILAVSTAITLAFLA
jgi:hypothetical protein